MAISLPKAPNLPIAPNDYSQLYINNIFNVLRLYFNQVDNFAYAVSTPGYGTTANRPINNLIIGQQYFDQTLGYPIWWKGKVWVNASGTTV